jgi:hypothetical protein
MVSNPLMEMDTYDVRPLLSQENYNTEFPAFRKTGFNGPQSKAFKERELLKAANIYSQFDKKGNLYENRLYAKTSINQAKL